MNGLLVRVGVDQAFGGWNAPVDANGRFVYVPIPEKEGTRFHPGLERKYGEVLPALYQFAAELGMDWKGLGFPEKLLPRSMHLDPDFECLTYGNKDNTRGGLIRSLKSGDRIVFYGGLRPVHRCDQKLIYALVGIYVVDEVVAASSIPRDNSYENAHTRKVKPGPNDVVVRAKPGESGRFQQCLPVGEWRDKAFRVRRDLLRAWGGLSVRDGFIQRSAVPPSLSDPRRFLEWLDKQDVKLLRRNN